MREQFRRLAPPLIVWKLALIAFALLSVHLLPPLFYAQMYRANFVSPAAVGGHGAILETWDAQHYIHLAVYGYRPNAISNNFWPLWPACIAAGIFAGMSPLVSSLVLSNVFSLAGLLLFHRLVAADSNETTADVALLAQIAFPTAFFFVLPYSESLFYLLVIGLFLALRHERNAVAAALAFLVPLARPVGAFIVVPLLATRKWKPLAAAIAGVLAYFAIMVAFTGDPLAGPHQQEHFRAGASLLRLIDLRPFLAALVARAPLRAYTASVISRLFFVLFLSTLLPLWRRNRAWFWYAVVMGMVPAVTLAFGGFSRYVLVVFPMFALAGEKLSGDRAAPWRAVILGASLALQIAFFLLHINNHLDA